MSTEQKKKLLLSVYNESIRYEKCKGNHENREKTCTFHLKRGEQHVSKTKICTNFIVD